MRHKISILLFTLTVVLGAISSCQNTSQSSEEEASAVTVSGPEGEVITSYLQLKEALVATDAAKAKQAAETLAEKAEMLKDETLKADIIAKANTITESDDIEMQRAQLNELSASIYSLAKSNETGLELYYQHCPMANEGNGGYWLSSTKEIQNPYFGSKMMKCGSVKEEL